MAGEESLPFGWTEQVASKDGEKLKFYYNFITGHKFYCKADLLHYVELGSPSLGTAQQTHSPQNESKPMATETNNNPDWLPQGWIMEVKVRSDEKKRKVYTDPSTGRKFMSKPEVLRFLHSEKENDPMSEQAPMGVESDNNLLKGEPSGAETPPKPEGPHTSKETCSPGPKITSSSTPRKKKVEIVRCEAEGLPEGWVKEIKIERKGKTLRKDPYYTDPESKYVLRSMPDVLRFLETKDLKSCAIRPRKREDLKFLNDDTSILEEKLSLDNEDEENIETEEKNAPKTDQLPKTPFSKRKRGRPRAASSSEPANSSTKPNGENVNSISSRCSTRITRGNGGTEGKTEETLEPEHVNKLGGL